MTKKEWIDNDLSFYHLTQESNISSILEKGLEMRKPFGICVIRSKHPDILEYLCQTMLFVTDETNFAILEIKPSKHGLTVKDIADDNVTEETNKLHNYIRRNLLKIEPEDILGFHDMKLNSISDYELYKKHIRSLGIIEPLL